jgi:hypothetical protein
MKGDFAASWNDALKQKTYSIYQGEEEPEYLGMADGHSPEHAISKMAQYEEIDPRTLSALVTWPEEE